MNEHGRDEVCTTGKNRAWPSAGPTPRGQVLRPGRVLVVAVLVLVALQPARAGNLQVDGSFVSTVPTGTPPLSVASTTRVDGLNADLLDGQEASAFTPAAERVLWVSPSGGDFSSVQAALDSITDASASNRYLVRVGPGIFTEPVTMKPFVDVEGSGEGVTTLRAFADATVTGASNAELRDLTVENFSASSIGGKGIHNPGTAPRIVRVTVRVEVSGNSSIGIHNDGASPFPGPLLRDVTVLAEGFQARGVDSGGTGVRIEDSKITARGHHARAIANHSGASVDLERLEVIATHGDNGNDTAVYGIWSSASAVRMADVGVRANGGSASYGVYHQDGTSRAEMTRVRAFSHASGGLNAYGTYTVETTLDAVECELIGAGGSSSNVGLANRRSNVSIYRSELRAEGTFASGLSSFTGAGAGSTGPWVVEVHASQLWGSDWAVLNSADFTVKLGASFLGGGSGVYNPSGGTAVCAGVYNETFTFYPDTCP